jgi:hypothetical protein
MIGATRLGRISRKMIRELEAPRERAAEADRQQQDGERQHHVHGTGQ